MTRKQIYDFDKNRHSVYSLQYHLILCVKYRKKVFVTESIINRLKEINNNISEKHNIELINQETDKDHVHIIFKTKPQNNLITYVNNLKGVSSRLLRKEFSDFLKNKLWGDSFWNNSYCLITTGQVTLDQLKKYVENQGK